mgnify:FL=1
MPKVPDLGLLCRWYLPTVRPSFPCSRESSILTLERTQIRRLLHPPPHPHPRRTRHGPGGSHSLRRCDRLEGDQAVQHQARRLHPHRWSWCVSPARLPQLPANSSLASQEEDSVISLFSTPPPCLSASSPSTLEPTRRRSATLTAPKSSSTSRTEGLRSRPSRPRPVDSDLTCVPPCSLLSCSSLYGVADFVIRRPPS